MSHPGMYNALRRAESGLVAAARTRPTMDEEARLDGLGYIETYERNQPFRVTVFDGDHQFGNGVALIEVTGEIAEHPGDVTRRALSAARRERHRRQQDELDRLRERGDELLAAAEDVGDGVTHATGKPTTAQMIDRLCRLDQARREWKEARRA